MINSEMVPTETAVVIRVINLNCGNSNNLSFLDFNYVNSHLTVIMVSVKESSCQGGREWTLVLEPSLGF